MPNTRNSAKYIMVVDVETTGLIPRKRELINKTSNPKPLLKELKNIIPEDPYYRTPNLNDIEIKENIDLFPYITQFSFVIYDMSKKQMVYCYDNFIKLPDSITIEPKAKEITGITEEICNQKGISINDALLEFTKNYLNCHTIVGHNIYFDLTCIRCEILRNYDYLCKQIPYINCICNIHYNKLLNDIYDTCFRTIKICKIEKSKKDGGIFYKPPKLSELHNILFHEPPENLHNSLFDVIVCLRCYLKIINYI